MLGDSTPQRGPQGGPAGELYSPDGGKTWLEKPPAQQDVAARAAEIRELIGALPPEARGQFGSAAQQPAPAQPVYAGPTQDAQPQYPAHGLDAWGNPVPLNRAAGAPQDAVPAGYGVAPQDAVPAGAPSTDPNENHDLPFSHWLHLADGTVRRSLGVVTHWHPNDDPKTPGVPIVAAIANPEYQQGAGDVQARVRSLIAELAGLTGIDLSNLARSL